MAYELMTHTPSCLQGVSNVAKEIPDAFVHSQPEAMTSSTGPGTDTHTSTNLCIQELNSGTISRSGPGKSARRAPCLVAGCSKVFHCPYLLEGHMHTHDGERRGELYLLCSKESILTFTYSISLPI
jgi:hypothetical protein